MEKPIKQLLDYGREVRFSVAHGLIWCDIGSYPDGRGDTVAEALIDAIKIAGHHIVDLDNWRIVDAQGGLGGQC